MKFVTYLKGLGADLKRRNYILIDEIQYLHDPTHFLKLLFDEFPFFKLFVTGSSTLEIRRKFKDSLAGRKVVFELAPLDFSEFLMFNRENNLASLVDQFSLRNTVAHGSVDTFPLKPFQKKLLSYCSQFVLFGGYPRIVLEPAIDKKITFLDELIQAYVGKDIKDLMRVDNVVAFNNLVKMLALQIGNLVTCAELATALNMARETIDRYLFLLENTFIIKRVYPFFSNRRKEVVKMPKVFFLDTGLRNALLRSFQDLGSRPDAGCLVENAVFGNLYKNSPVLEEIFFWRTRSRNEVDFILHHAHTPLPVEVKFRPFRGLSLPAGLRSFTRDYRCKNAVVLMQDGVEMTGSGEVNLFFLPVWAA